MYRLKLYNVDDSSNKHTILDLSNGISEVSSASLERQINSIDSSSVDLFHSFLIKTGFTIKSFKTMLEIYNTKKSKYEFRGRVITPDHSMESSGEFKHQLTFEGAKAFLKDSLQKQSFEFDKEPIDLLKLVINHHNIEVGVDTYKRFTVGTVDVPKPVIPVDDVYREEEKYFYRYDDKDTLSTIEEDLVNKYGGVIVIEIKESTNVIHWYKDYVKQTNTKISLGENLQSIQYKIDPTEIITRLKPLGASSETANGQEIKLTIADVNNGSPYIDIPELQAIYGIQTGAVEFSDMYTPETLKTAALKWKNEQNKKVANVSISLEALDLELLGLRPDSLEIYNMHLVEVPPLYINDKMKVVGESIDLIQPHNKSVTIGEKPLTMDDIQRQIARERTREVERKMLASTTALKKEIDYHQKVITGEIGGVLTIKDAEGNMPIKNGQTQFNLGVWSFKPQFMSEGVSVDGVFYKTKNTSSSVFDAYNIIPQQRYLTVILSCYIDTPGATGTVEIINFKDSETKFYQSAVISAIGSTNQQEVTLTINLESISTEKLSFYLRFYSSNQEATIYAREMFVGTTNG